MRNGEFDRSNWCIYVHPELTKEDLFETLLHEALHAVITFTTGNDVVSDSEEETFVYTMSGLLAQVLEPLLEVKEALHAETNRENSDPVGRSRSVPPQEGVAADDESGEVSEAGPRNSSGRLRRLLLGERPSKGPEPNS